MVTRHLARALALLALLVPAGSARADDAGDARSRQAEALFERGRDLLAAGDVQSACALLAESQRLDPGGGTLLNLAVCHERAGRLATAWAEYHDALSAAIRDGRVDRQSLATERIHAMEPRLPHLRVLLPRDAPAGIEVRVDGVPLSSLALGAPLPEDPGPHEVTASAPGRISSTTHATLEEGKDVEVTVAPLAMTPALAPPPPERPHLATGAYVAGGVALAGYGVMAVTGILALEAESKANGACQGQDGFCANPSGPSDASQARTMAWASTVSLGVALAATAAAVFWPKTRATAAAPKLGVGELRIAF